ncbi:MAG: D-glycero-alpha-D-manno-heptose-1,7-bisphosphate 7-phosphatase [Armatimonadota bacterium]
MTIVFLDRDGVINENRKHYVRTADEFTPLPGSLEAIARLSSNGIHVAIISNQAGVGRGLIEIDDLEQINNKMLRLIKENGGQIAGIYYCTHRKDEGCTCRKPETELFSKACEDLSADSACGYLVGDAKSDIDAGRKIGCRTILVLSGRTLPEEVTTWDYRPDHIVQNLSDAVDIILHDLRK